MRIEKDWIPAFAGITIRLLVEPERSFDVPDHRDQARPEIILELPTRTSGLGWHDRKMKKEKCVMGLPLYGRPSGIKQQARVKTYATILESGGILTKTALL